MREILNGEWKCPLNVSDTVEQIQKLMSSKQVQYNQILNERNQLVY